MPRVALRTDAPGASPLTVVKETVTTKTTTPTGPGAPMAPLAGERPEKEDINVYFANLNPTYRADHIACYLYRLDRNITIVPNAEIPDKFKSRIHKFTDEELGKFAQGAFLQDLAG